MDLVNHFSQRHEEPTEAGVTVQTSDGKEYVVIRCAESYVLFFDENGDLQVKSVKVCSWSSNISKQKDMATHTSEDDFKHLAHHIDQGILMVKSKPVLSPSYWSKRRVWVLDTTDMGYVIIRPPLAARIVAHWREKGWQHTSIADIYNGDEDPSPPNPDPRDTPMIDTPMSVETPLPTTEKVPCIPETPTPSPPMSQANMANRASTPAVNFGNLPSVSSTKGPLVKLYGRHIPFMTKGNSDRRPNLNTYCTYKWGENYGIKPWRELQELSEKQKVTIIERSPECGIHPPTDAGAIRELFKERSEKLGEKEFEVIGWGQRPMGDASYNTPMFRITDKTKWDKFRAKRVELGVREDDLEDPVICSVTDYKFAVAGNKIDRADVKHLLEQTPLGLKFLKASGQRSHRERSKTPDHDSELMPFIQRMKDELENNGMTLSQLMARVEAMEDKLKKLK